MFRYAEKSVMKFSRRLVLTFFSGFVPLLLLGFPATAETVINVSLWDKGPTSMDNMDTLKPMGMAMAGANMEMATMGIKVDVSEISAGSVTVRVLNESQDFYHSLAISLVEDPSKELPYLIDKKMVDEDAAGRAAQVKELKPHDSGSVTVEMKPGTYILYCNIAGHYLMGMWTIVTVTD
jgi:uncharacterized cupredoxin-like copper-binding protein